MAYAKVRSDSLTFENLAFEHLDKHVERSDLADIIYLAFQKAFDKVLCKRLLSKSSSHGTAEQECNQLRAQETGNKNKWGSR